jgi:hypothetical protein
MALVAAWVVEEAVVVDAAPASLGGGGALRNSCGSGEHDPNVVRLCLVGKGLTEQQMIPEMAALFFAGSDTTAHTAAFCL